jgi:hypothetical protein
MVASILAYPPAQPGQELKRVFGEEGESSMKIA